MKSKIEINNPEEIERLKRRAEDLGLILHKQSKDEKSLLKKVETKVATKSLKKGATK